MDINGGMIRIKIPKITFTEGNPIPVITYEDLIIDVTTERTKMYSGFESGKRITSQTFAVNSGGKGPPSDAISVIVP